MIRPRMSTLNGPLVLVEDLERYTVITASGRDIEAIESCSGRSGAFTSQLLKVLTSSDTYCLTYVSLLHHLACGMSTEHNEYASFFPLFSYQQAVHEYTLQTDAAW